MFSQRSQEKELLDLGPDFYTDAEYDDCLKKLFWVNKLLGFFRGTVQVLKRYSADASVLDVGCGGGLFILHLSRCFPRMKLQGSDISVGAIKVAQQTLQDWQRHKPDINVSFELQKQHALKLASNSVDIILLTLVCHHLSDEELIIFLQEAQFAASQAVIINDLHRHRIAHWFYSLLSPVLFRNRLITHDGLISIRRGFTRHEWQRILQQAGIDNYELKWRFPFRWQLILPCS
jgi:2-polyprenyl-3-methyl-5-hydroxy-6-metoxy-1,4-benzoquinol methylase